MANALAEAHSKVSLHIKRIPTQSQQLITRNHSFPQATEFRAEPRNLYISAEFHEILQKLRNDQR